MSVKAEQLEITSPCPITLDRSAIGARDKAMFCAHCTKDVHLLSQMTEPEARALMKTQAGRDICVSYAIRDDGSIRFREEPSLVPVTALLSRRPSPAPVSAKVDAPRRRMSLVASIGASMLLAACTPHGEPEPEVLVGNVQVQVEEPIELHEDTPCDDPMPVAGGLRAEPLPEPELVPEPEQMVDGGLKAQPLPEPPAAKISPRRGGLRARPIEIDRDPLLEL